MTTEEGIIHAFRTIRREQQDLLKEMEELVNATRKGIKRGVLSVKALAEVDRIRAISLIVAAGICPNLKEAHKRVTKLLGPMTEKEKQEYLKRK